MPVLFSSLMNHTGTSQAELQNTLTDCLDGEDVDLEAVEMDRDEEASGLVDELEVDEIAAQKAFRRLADDSSSGIDLSDLAESLKQASEDVIVGKTAQEYATYVDSVKRRAVYGVLMTT